MALRTACNVSATPIGARGALVARMGLNTGLVVVGEIGDNLRMDYTAVGDTTNVAARLQARRARRDPHQRRDLPARSEPRGHEYLGPLSVRWEGRTGERAPGARAKIDTIATGRGPERATHAIRGPSRELENLHDALAEAERGPGQVGIVGEPGMGKSRLLMEFRQELAGRSVTFLEGQCLSYGTAIPYLPSSICSARTAAWAEETPEQVRAKVRVAVEEVGLDPDSSLPFLLHVLGVKPDRDADDQLVRPGNRQGPDLRGAAPAFLRGSRLRTLVLLIEDLHWIDALSEEYATTLVERAAGAPLLLVFTYRPGHCPRWADGSHGTQLALPLLAPDESRGRAGARGAGGADARRAGDIERILSQAEGNPLFLEELTRAAVDQGEVPAGAPVPDLVQDVLGARIDRLPDAARRLLQIASVVGRQVSLRLLRAVWEEPQALDDALGELVHPEFLHEAPRAAEPTYCFKHALVHEVTYATLLERRRRVAHGTIGRALESLYAGRTDEVAELLAYHFGRSEASAKAVDYGILAAEKAQRQLAHVEALTHFDGALERLVLMPDSKLTACAASTRW